MPEPVPAAEDEETDRYGALRQSHLRRRAPILFTPTPVASIFGMNFDHMPELHWTLGHPFALALMAGFGVGLWGVVKWRHWL